MVFKPLVVSTAATATKCNYRRPEWLTRALADPAASVRLKAYARSLETYQNDPGVDYIKLLDGGLTDNIGVTGFSMERAAAETAHGPALRQGGGQDAYLRLHRRRLQRRTEGDWVKTLNGPKLRNMVERGLERRHPFLGPRRIRCAERFPVEIWRGQLIAWRCSLPRETVRKYRGTLAGWDCRDVDLIVEDVSFDDFPQAERARLNDIETRLKLPADQVDLLISAGRDSIRMNPRLQQVFGEVQRRAGVAPLSASLD